MDPLRYSYPAFHYSSPPVKPLAPSGSPNGTVSAEFPDALAPRSVSSSAISFLTRVTKEAKASEYRFIASAALAALTKETLPLSRALEAGAYLAQYGIRVWNDKGAFLGKLMIDVRHGAAGGYDLTAVSLIRSESSPPVGFSLASYNVLQEVPSSFSQPLLPSGTKARAYPTVAYSELIKARSMLTQAIRQYNKLGAKASAPWQM
jgi:hypothetical protein